MGYQPSTSPRAATSSNHASSDDGRGNIPPGREREPAMDEIYSRNLMKRLSRRRLLALGGSAGAAGLLAACGGRTAGSSGSAGPSTGGDGTGPTGVARPTGWTDATHGKDAEPDYGTVFPTTAVNTLTIRVSAETWDAMLANMTELFGTRGTTGSGGAPQGGEPPGGGGPPGGGAPREGGIPQDGAAPGAAGRQPGGGFPAENPDWFAGTIEFKGNTWTNVGVRFKGNSSLRGAWTSGTDRIPFKLDFDEFEGDHPETADQRFHGFKQLSLGSNFSDPSFIRETVGYGILAEAGLVHAKTGLYEVFLDRGAGAASLGLYTAIEVIDDTVVKRSFKDGSGNIYEADGPAASFAEGVLGQIDASFEAEGGENPDRSDIRALYQAIHAPERTSNPETWRRKLEAVFDMDAYLEWLAIAATMKHWDTYGAMSHNYYLYNNPETGRLMWISWDHNQVLSSSGGGGAGRPGGGGGGLRMSTSLDKADVTSQWPLIRYVLDDATYRSRYLAFLRESLNGPFAADRLERWYRELQGVIEPRIAAAGKTAFVSAIDSLVATTRSQDQAVKDFLANQ